MEIKREELLSLMIANMSRFTVKERFEILDWYKAKPSRTKEGVYRKHGKVPLHNWLQKEEEWRAQVKKVEDEEKDATTKKGSVFSTVERIMFESSPKEEVKRVLSAPEENAFGTGWPKTRAGVHGC